MYIYIYAYIYICIYTHTHARAHTHTDIYIYIYFYTYICTDRLIYTLASFSLGHCLWHSRLVEGCGEGARLPPLGQPGAHIILPSDSNKASNIGALIIRIGFWGPLYIIKTRTRNYWGLFLSLLGFKVLGFVAM